MSGLELNCPNCEGKTCLAGRSFVAGVLFDTYLSRYQAQVLFALMPEQRLQVLEAILQKLDLWQLHHENSLPIKTLGASPTEDSGADNVRKGEMLGLQVQHEIFPTSHAE
ncbi:MAG: hypothetical protein HC800_19815 [Phormidesmis sp. RL_2_1]|nr:hypothetical protein [Phormidesmis sp. RL_2_1]